MNKQVPLTKTAAARPKRVSLQYRRSFLATIRRRQLWLRSMAGVVLFAFLNLYLQPLALAANLPSPPAPKEPTNEEKLSRTLETIEDRLEKLEARLEKSQDASAEKSELTALRQQIQTLDAQAIKDFDAIEAQLKDKKLPQVILDRHYQAVSAYKQEMQTLKANLDDIGAASDDGDRRVKAKKAREHLKAKQKKRAHTPVDPNNLPFRVPDGKARKPKQTPAEYRAMFKPEPVQVASTELTSGMLAPDLLSAALVAAPGPADLAPTEDVQITDDIRALATSLGNNPVKIYNWVRNNISFVPTYGSIQGSQLCLETKQCNAFDTASLLIALLRASNIPAHYVYGTVQIPIEKVMNWVGGVTVPEAALQLLGQGGIPNIGIVQGGKISAVEMEHVWVEAFVDFHPSRGAINKQSDTWVGMDGAFKQHLFTQAMDLRSVAFDQSTVDQLRSAVTATADGVVTSIDAERLHAGFDAVYAKAKNYLEQTRPDANAADVVGSRIIIQESPSVLPSKLPYTIVATGSRFAALASNLRHYLSVNLYADPISRTLNRPDLTYQIGLPSLGYKTFTLSYSAATSADLVVLANNLDPQGGVPPYLVSVKPVLNLSGETVAAGSEVGLAAQQELTLTVISPNLPAATQNKVLTVGSYNAIVPQYSTVMPVHFQAILADVAATKTKLESNDITGIKKDDIFGAILYSAGLGYWAQSDLFNRLVASHSRVIRNSLQRVGVFSLELYSEYVFGIPIKAKPGSFVADVRISIETATSANGDPAVSRDYLKASLTLMSRLEGTIWEQIVRGGSRRGITAATFLAQAGQSGIPIYEARPDNVAAVINQLTVSAAVKADISNAVATGKVVYVARDNITVQGWTGSGYIVRDPQTGSAAYLISGGLNGGEYIDAVTELQHAAHTVEDGSALLLTLMHTAEALDAAVGHVRALAAFAPFVLILSMLLEVIKLLAILTQYALLDCFPGPERFNFVLGLLTLFAVSAISPYFGLFAVYAEMAYLYEWGGILRLLVAEAFIRGETCRVPIPNPVPCPIPGTCG